MCVRINIWRRRQCHRNRVITTSTHSLRFMEYACNSAVIILHLASRRAINMSRLFRALTNASQHTFNWSLNKSTVVLSSSVPANIVITLRHRVKYNRRVVTRTHDCSIHVIFTIITIIVKRFFDTSEKEVLGREFSTVPISIFFVILV